MIRGVFTLDRVKEKSFCRLSLDSVLVNGSSYKVHSTVMMPNIPFGKAIETPSSINKGIFLNDKDTKMTSPSTIKTQNYVTSKFTGEDYELSDPANITHLGEKFSFKTEDGSPNKKYRSFKLGGDW